MSTYVLVHGAWHGSWCWSRLAAALRMQGHRVLTPDLPGHGDDRMDGRKTTARDYINAVQELITGQSEPVILLGHSMGGMVISGVAEQIPARIETLVYLGGFLLIDGESINDLEGRVTGSLLAPHMAISHDRNSFNVPIDIVRDAFYADCSEEDFQFALTRLRPQPLLPFITPISISTARYGSVPRIYIECLQDRSLPLVAQRFMHARTQCEKIFTLDAGHAAFFSASHELAGILLPEAG